MLNDDDALRMPIQKIWFNYEQAILFMGHPSKGRAVNHASCISRMDPDQFHRDPTEPGQILARPFSFRYLVHTLGIVLS
jgi:hypothetical protein